MDSFKISENGCFSLLSKFTAIPGDLGTNLDPWIPYLYEFYHSFTQTIIRQNYASRNKLNDVIYNILASKTRFTPKQRNTIDRSLQKN
jgi:hypothetical protein